MMSNLSIKSQYTEREIKFANNKNKRIVPISIDGTTINDCDWLCFLLKDTDFIDPQKSYQWEKLINNIIKWTSKPTDNENQINKSKSITKEQQNNKKLSSNEIPVAIEFNASGIRASYIENEIVKLVTFSNGKTTLPSSIVYKDGEWIFGKPELLKSDSGETSLPIVFDIPHLIFSNNENIQHIARLYNIQLEETIYGELKFCIDEQLYTTQNIAAIYFKMIKEEIEKQTSISLDKVVIVISSILDLSQIKILKETCAEAGLKIRQYHSTLAALIHLEHKNPDENNSLIVDIHKQSLSISVIITGDQVYEVKSLCGVNSVNNSQIEYAIKLAMKEANLKLIDINQIYVLNRSIYESFSPVYFKTSFPNAKWKSYSSEDTIKGGCLIAGCHNGYLKERLPIIPLNVIPHNILIATDGGYSKIITANTTIPTKRSIKIKNNRGQNCFLIKIYTTLPYLSISEEIGKRKMLAQYTAYIGEYTSNANNASEYNNVNEFNLSVDIDALLGIIVELFDAKGKKITLHKENYSEDYSRDLPAYCPN